MVGVGGTRWTQPELRRASPEVLDAARWLVFAERIWPGADTEARLLADDHPSEATALRMKREGRAHLRQIRKVLLPPDEVTDGD